MDYKQTVVIRNKTTGFYLVIAAVATLITVVGFARSYFLRGYFTAVPLSWLAHAHGLSMMLWYALFVVQAVLISKGNVALHRRLGMSLVVGIPLILGIGVITMIEGAKIGHTPLPAVPFLAISTVLFFQFALLSGLGIALRKRPEVHKRLMLLALISTLAPAFTRMPFAFFFIGFPFSTIFWSNFLVLVCCAYERIKFGKIHPVFVAGGVFLVVLQLGSLVMATTKTWESIALWMLR